jgi:hypothetical protein
MYKGNYMDIHDIEKIYPETAALVGMAQSVWNGNTQVARIDIAVSDKLKAALQQLLGKDIQSVFITDSDARHIKKKHGQGERARGQIDIIPEDFAYIPFILNEFDTAEQDVTDKMNNKKMLFTKIINGTFYLALIERGQSRIQIRTLWKTPGQVPHADPKGSP